MWMQGCCGLRPRGPRIAKTFGRARQQPPRTATPTMRRARGLRVCTDSRIDAYQQTDNGTGIVDPRRLRLLRHSSTRRGRRALCSFDRGPAQAPQLVQQGSAVGRRHPLQRCERAATQHDAGGANAAGIGRQRCLCTTNAGARRLRIAGTEDAIISGAADTASASAVRVSTAPAPQWCLRCSRAQPEQRPICPSAPTNDRQRWPQDIQPSYCRCFAKQVPRQDGLAAGSGHAGVRLWTSEAAERAARSARTSQDTGATTIANLEDVSEADRAGSGRDIKALGQHCYRAAFEAVSAAQQRAQCATEVLALQLA
jgi:hypothetical protein